MTGVLQVNPLSVTAAVSPLRGSWWHGALGSRPDLPLPAERPQAGMSGFGCVICEGDRRGTRTAHALLSGIMHVILILMSLWNQGADSGLSSAEWMCLESSGPTVFWGPSQLGRLLRAGGKQADV